MPLRILYIVSTLARCGPVNVLHGIVKHLDRNEFEPVILTLSEEIGDSLKQDFVDMGVKCHTLGLSRFEFLMVGKSRIQELVDTLQPALIHTHGFRADIAIGSIQTAQPLYSTVHNNPLEDYRYLFGRIIGTSLYNRHLAALGKITYPVVVGNHIKKLLADNLKREVKVIENGIDTERYAPASEEAKCRKRNEMKLAQGSIVYIYTGVLTKRKDPERIIRAFKDSSLCNSAYLMVVGTGPLYSKCVRYADERVRVTGSVQDVKGFLDAADVYISSSKSEGIPMSVLEAMSCGLSVVLSDIPSHREILSNSTDCGLLFDSSTEALVSALNLSSDKNALHRRGQAAREAVKARYSSQSMSAKYSALYKQGVLH